MKRFLAIAIVAMTFTACHYGQDEAQKTLERNDLYKGDKAEYSVNRAGGDEVAAEETPAADSTATAAPATDSAHAAPATPAKH